MKKLSLVAFAATFALCAYSQTVMTIAGDEVSKQEFEYYYNKNTVGDSLKMSIEEYLERFINFKLKVAEAKSLKMDTVSSFKKELAGYRNQLIQPYLVDSAKINELVAEEYARLNEDVDVSHILFRIGQDGDTLAAYNKAQEALKRLEKESFEAVAASLSEDPSMVGDSGRIGWITGLNTVYPFECAAYGTPVGEHSDIIRSIFGYHIVKVNARRASRGQIKVAHIFLRKNPDYTEKQLDSLKKEVYKIQQEIKAGKISFSDAAAKYSNDGNGKNGGELPWITTGKTNEIFEDAAFALENSDDVSAPVEAPYGWHIIRLIEKKPIDSYADMKEAILSRMKGDERREIIYKSFINKLKKEYNFTLPTSKKDNFLARFADVTLTKDSLDAFVAQNKNIGKDTLDIFFSKKLYEYEERNLEKRYPEFGLLMNEYRDGILMFNISQTEVWNKAAKDTTGLREYFEANREKYDWTTPHYKGIIVHCSSKEVKKRAQTMLSTVDYDNAYQCLANLNVEGQKNVKLERGVYPEGKNTYIDILVFKKKGELPVNKKYPIVFVTGKMLGLTPESYKDVKGPLLSDFQSYIESKWVEKLRAKYLVNINSEVLNTVK